ncbi:MAG: hypothetical protein RMY62_004095 [Nostoc sp. ZfuVER08]|uniref:Uncharacterized protein n=1 Tax=Nostoc punctiforme FACHB-252 TaxID=1357509 RepID=A0ABR8H1J1_NOSPU|nr:hypothetical protein [Nostoc punctiforme]MBD2609690.1 hypothetical protein [Nostoc punctiforme FACHB-252]MDZ8012891.1 hypothetical protein [Nostoc sp. ZfuVER08]
MKENLNNRICMIFWLLIKRSHESFNSCDRVLISCFCCDLAANRFAHWRFYS